MRLEQIGLFGFFRVFAILKYALAAIAFLIFLVSRLFGADGPFLGADMNIAGLSIATDSAVVKTLFWLAIAIPATAFLEALIIYLLASLKFFGRIKIGLMKDRSSQPRPGRR